LEANDNTPPAVVVLSTAKPSGVTNDATDTAKPLVSKVVAFAGSTLPTTPDPMNCRVFPLATVATLSGNVALGFNWNNVPAPSKTTGFCIGVNAAALVTPDTSREFAIWMLAVESISRPESAPETVTAPFMTTALAPHALRKPVVLTAPFTEALL